MTSAKERLEASLREAERELQILAKRLEGRPKIGLGEGDAASTYLERILARQESVTARIEALRKALARVNEGTYGRCARCGSDIDPERLEFLPTTSLCAACAQSASRGLR